MVTVDGSQVFDEDTPLPVTPSPGPVGTFAFAVSDTEFSELLDVLERIQEQLAMINNGNNLAPGERFFT